MTLERTLWALTLLAAAGILGCTGETAPPRLKGAGSSFVDPMMQHWAADYRTKTKVEVDYKSVGSSRGIEEMIQDHVAFGCTDAPMSADQIKTAGGEDEVLHVPLVTGPVVVIYNLDNVKGLKFTGEVLAKIYLGEIRQWDDPAIQNLNKDAKLPPNQKITVVRRADGSGTSYIFTDYLYSASKDWRDAGIEPSTDPNWKKGDFWQAESKNPGVLKAVSTTHGAIGYVELLYALQEQEKLAKDNQKTLNIALVANTEGNYPDPGVLANITKAAEAKLKEKPAPEHLRISIVNAKDKDAYPICGVVYAVCKVKQPQPLGKVLREYLRWCLTEGQAATEALHYAKLPPELAEAALKKIDKIK